MSWVDPVIILILAAAIVKGLQTGLLELILSFGGLIAGLFIGSRLAEILATLVSKPFQRFMIVTSLELGLSALFWMLGLGLSHRLKPRLTHINLSRVNAIAGGTIEVLAILFIVWILASGLSNIRSYGIGRSVRHSFIVSELDRTLPAPPDVLAKLNNIVSPNTFPNVFLGLEPSHTTVSPKNQVDNQAVLDDEPSIVKVQGLGCGAAIFGSGFVVDQDLVVTNAHVVAGLKRPQVVDSQKTYSSIPVAFDPELDLAILKVNNLKDPPLKLLNKTLPGGSAVATLGFPGGGDLEAQDATIIDHTTALGRNIYNMGMVSRDIYEVQVVLQPGDSGSPLLAPDGSVAGVVFGKAVTQSDVGYALMIDQVQPMLNQARHQTKAVDTRFCD